MILKDKITCIKHMASGRYLISGGCYHSFNPTAQLISTLTKGDDYGVLVTVRIWRHEDRLITDSFRSPLEFRSWSCLYPSNSVHVFWSWVLCIRYQCLWDCSLLSFKSRLNSISLQSLTISSKTPSHDDITRSIFITDISLIGIWDVYNIFLKNYFFALDYIVHKNRDLFSLITAPTMMPYMC